MAAARRLVLVGSAGVVLAFLLFKLSEGEIRVRPPDPMSQSQPPTIAGLLADQRLWDADAVALFGSLPAWRAAGESTLAVFPTRAAGTAPYDDSAQVQSKVAAFAAGLKQARPGPAPEFAAQLSRVRARAASARVEAVRLREDDRFHLVYLLEGGRLLKAGLTSSQIREAYGAPERTTTEVIHSDGDRRPTVLTIHHYAGGAVRFAESDLAPRPGVVDRVLIDVAAASAQLFR